MRSRSIMLGSNGMISRMEKDISPILCVCVCVCVRSCRPLRYVCSTTNIQHIDLKSELVNDLLVHGNCCAVRQSLQMKLVSRSLV